MLSFRSLIALTAAALAAQSAQPPADRRFEAASIKPTLSPFERGQQDARAANGGRTQVFFGIRTTPGGRFNASTVSLKDLIARAFDLKDYQIEGGPKWIASDYFEIAATAGGEATAAEFNTMLKALLVERFGLRTHSETRQMPIRVLTVARSDGRLGAGLKRTSAECDQQIEARKSGAPPPAPPPPMPAMPTTPTCGMMMMIGRVAGGRTVLMGGMEPESLVNRISSEVAGPVLDRTGLSGRFDITLEYTPERQGVSLNPNSNDTPLPPIAAALQEQLGLKLEKQTGPLSILVIDAADHPTPD